MLYIVAHPPPQLARIAKGSASALLGDSISSAIASGAFAQIEINRVIPTPYDQLGNRFLGMVHLAIARCRVKFAHAVQSSCYVQLFSFIHGLWRDAHLRLMIIAFIRRDRGEGEHGVNRRTVINVPCQL